MAPKILTQKTKRMDAVEICLQPYEFFGLDPQTATLKELRRKYYEVARCAHPDCGGRPEDMRRIHNTYRWIQRQLEIVEGRPESEVESRTQVVTEHIPRWGALVWEVCPVPFETVAEWVGGGTVFVELQPFIEAMIDRMMQNNDEILEEPFRELAHRFQDREQASAGNGYCTVPSCRSNVPGADDVDCQEPVKFPPRTLIIHQTLDEECERNFGADYREAYRESEDIAELVRQFERAPKLSVDEALQQRLKDRA